MKCKHTGRKIVSPLDWTSEVTGGMTEKQAREFLRLLHKLDYNQLATLSAYAVQRMVAMGNAKVEGCGDE